MIPVFFAQEPIAVHLTLLLVVSIGYVFYRRWFAPLPLQRDTGFYVPNYSIANKKFGPFHGWNTYFSGASRIVPQFIHTLLFLRSGGESYGRTFRSFYSVLTLITGMLVGITAQFIVQETWVAWCAFVLYLLVAAESQYGPYFESAEIFQVFMQSAGFLLVMVGLHTENPWIAASGISLFWLDTLTVKLTGGAVAVLLSAAVFYFHRDWWLGLAIPAGLTPILYILWVRLSGRTLKENFHYLKEHEIHVRRNYRNPVFLLLVKTAWIAKLVLYNPFIPLLAVPGALFFFSETTPNTPAFICVSAYLLGALAGYYKQGHRVCYFMFPFLPIVAIFAAVSLETLSARFSPGPILAVGGVICLLSIGVNLRQKINQTLAEFNRRVWSTHNRPGGKIGDMMSDGNYRLEQFAAQIRSRVAGSSLLVIGPYNQASVLLEAAYDTPLVSLCGLTKGLVGDAGPWLAENLQSSPPEFLIDTDDEYASYVEELPMLAGYNVLEEGFGMRLYQKT